MPHKKLTNPPIRYVLAQVRFTGIELIEKYIPEIQDKLRHDFPFNEKIAIHTFELRESGQANPSLVNQWHFKDKESENGIILDGKSITIHTSKHINFETLAKKLKDVLNVVNEVLNISVTLRLGVRYINIIDSSIEKFVNKELLGFKLNEKCFDKKIFLINTELNQKTDRGDIRIKVTRVGSGTAIFNESTAFVPFELQNSARLLSFAHQKTPLDEFVLLDLDHVCSLKDDFNIEDVVGKMKNLQHDIYLAFNETVTKDAIKAWE